MHDHFADFGGGQFPFRGLVDHAFDFVHDGFELGRGNGTLFAGFQEALQNFLALEAFAAAVFLDDHVGNFVDAFVGGEAAGAFQAFAAAANGVAGAALAGVNYLVVEMRAERALQWLDSPCQVAFETCRPLETGRISCLREQRPKSVLLGFARIMLLMLGGYYRLEKVASGTERKVVRLADPPSLSLRQGGSCFTPEIKGNI